KDLVFTDVDVPNATLALSDRPEGPGEIGYRDFEHIARGAKLAHDHMVWWAGQGSNAVAFARKTNAESIDTHGLWQYGEFTTQLYKPTSVQQRDKHTPRANV